jgi:small-conductance mechanosensitive channel
MKKIFLLLFFFTSTAFAQLEVLSIENNASASEATNLEDQSEYKIMLYLSSLEKIEEHIAKEKVWMRSYASYMTALDIRDKLEEIEKRIKYLKKKGRSVSELDELNALISKEKILTSQIEKLKENGSAPFSKLLTPPEMEDIPNITNPLEIFNGISFIKTQNAAYTEYLARKEKLSELIVLLQKESNIYKDILEIDGEGKYKDSYAQKLEQLKRFESALDTISVTAEVYQKRLEMTELNINKDIEKQVFKLINIGIIIFILFLILFIVRLAIKRYITDNERFYMANKIITFVNLTIIILVIFFNYIENVSYLVTILGFASAGIAIAMKDWFMSILGWLVIVFGGSIHVGDRIRVLMDGTEYVGDVMDISLLRMTVFEDITLTSVSVNRRAGRIVFIPNNFVFTRMIANYAHHSLKTVWDGVHITVTFDSNHKKAMHIAKEVAKKYSKGYTDITRKQLNKLRSHYSLKNTNVEPRIFSFIEPNGVMIDAWYLTNAYATLTLRSIISTEIVEMYNAEDDITIAYPTQKLHLQNEEKRTPPFETKESDETL